MSESTKLRQRDATSQFATTFLDALLTVTALALSATKALALSTTKRRQIAFDRWKALDMGKFDHNRLCLTSYRSAAPQRLTGARRIPVSAFAKHMAMTVPAEALNAGAAAARTEI